MRSQMKKSAAGASCVATLVLLLAAAAESKSARSPAADALSPLDVTWAPNGACELLEYTNESCTIHCESIPEGAGRAAVELFKNLDCETVIIYFHNCFYEERVLKIGWFPNENLPFQYYRLYRYDPYLEGMVQYAFDGFVNLKMLIDGQQELDDYKMRTMQELDHPSRNAARNPDYGFGQRYAFQIRLFHMDTVLLNIKDALFIFGNITILDDPYFKTLNSLYLDRFEFLERLTITNCGLTNIEPFTFHNRDTLYDVRLDNNQLATLKDNSFPDHWFEEESNFVSLGLSGNKWDCRTDLSWLADKIRRRPDIFENDYTSAPTCFLPEHCYGVPIANVDFSCDNSTSTIGTVVGSTMSPTICCGSTSTPDIEPTTIPIEQTTLSQPVPSTTVVPGDALPCEDAEIREVLRAHRSRRSLNFPPTRLFTVASAGGALEIELAAAAGAWTLFWVEQGGAPAPCYKHEGVGAARVTIEDALPNADYLICLLRGPRFDASPFNCRAHSTPPRTTANGL